MYRKIGNRKNLKREPIVSQLILNNIMEHIPDIILITDCNANFLDVNRGFEKITGYSKNEAVGQNASILKSGKTDPEIYTQMWEKILNGEIWKGELIDKKKNGNLFHVELTISPFKNIDKKGTSFIGIGRDVTRYNKQKIGFQKQSAKLEKKLEEKTNDIRALSDAEAAVLNMMEDLNEAKGSLERKVEERTQLLQKSEKEYRTLIEKAFDGIIVVDENGIISIWNNIAKKMFGYSANATIGKNLEIIIPGKDRERFRVGINSIVQTGNSDFIGKTVELEGLKKNGSTFPIEVSLSYEKDIAGKYHFMAIVRDITERKIMGKHLLQTEKLKSIGELAAGVAHEVNNPLAIMGIDLTLMEEYLPKDHPVLEHVQSLKFQLQRIGGIVKGLQNFSRPSNSPIEKIEINKLLRDYMVRIALNKLKKNHVQVKFFLKDFQGFVEASRTQLDQVFLNIINNAEAAMESKSIKIKKGDLKIKNYQKMLKISSKFLRKSSQLLIEFADNGIGIEEKNIKNIFNPFFTTKGVYGTGVGLSISNDFIKGFNGNIKVESIHRKGSSFKISLPVQT